MGFVHEENNSKLLLRTKFLKFDYRLRFSYISEEQILHEHTLNVQLVKGEIFPNYKIFTSLKSNFYNTFSANENILVKTSQEFFI